MKFRCDLHLNGGSRKLILMPGPNETTEHLALKLSAYLLFWDFDPIVQVSAKHPALLNQEFLPDLLALDDSGQARIWIECGNVAMNKLTKLPRRFPWSRIVVLKATEREAARLRRDLQDQSDRDDKIEVLGWPTGLFDDWMGALRENTEVYGESGGMTINAVVNEIPFVAELKRY